MTPTTFLISTRRALLASALVAAVVGCATGPTPSNLADTIANTPSLSTLHKLVIQAGLSDTLKTGGPFTVFAPSNDAFKAVPAATLSDLAQNPQKLKDVLSFHIIPAKLVAAEVKNSDVKTLHGANAAIAKAGDFVTVENAAVTQADIIATNGVVHVIDTVMMPPVKK